MKIDRCLLFSDCYDIVNDVDSSVHKPIETVGDRVVQRDPKELSQDSHVDNSTGWHSNSFE